MGVQFTEDEYNLLAELLRLAALDLQRTAQGLARRWPGSTFAERLRVWAEAADTLRRRIESRD